MKMISLKLPESLAQWLAEESKTLGRSQSDLVRDALEVRRKKSGKKSCHDLMQDLCGTLKGPRDLSTNPKYLDGFGQ